ncbi:hexose transporter [Fomitiporia mediterranea MF3/22]|uniref:hexose transporter n=1 Tax=Fomitiporia mediterranea (strain MF3/22) TaxID=694068 RepID=UPI0004409626|nr:hexose transporter [Fomitiporia mediterranea MF3/22]EJC97804.1 hexose transporter [Fomitiporia mediterranea MF3/22]
MGAGAALVANDKDTWKELLDPGRKFYNNRRLICLNAWIFLFLITSSSNGFDGSMMNGLQSLEQWEEDFNHPTGSMLGLLNAIQNIGSLGALPFAPYLSDEIGRRPSILLGATILWGATLLQTFSSSVSMFIGARFLVGFGTTIAANAAPMLVSEIAYPPHRAILTSLYNCMWYSGSIAAAWATFGCVKLHSSWAWRLPSLVQGIPSAAQVLLMWSAPESPRWLVCKGQESRALQVLARYHADGNQQDPLVVHELETIKTAIADDCDAAKANVGWSSFVHVPGNRRRLFILVALGFFSQWSGNGLVSYYLSEVFETIGITDPTMQLLINGLLQIWNLFISVGAAFLVDRLGRRFLFITSCAGMLAFFMMQTVCSAMFAETRSSAAAHAVIASIFLFYAAYDLAFTPLVVSYSIEILPFAIRAKGMAIYTLTVTLSLIFNQYVNPVALGALGWKYYIVYCVWLAFELVYCCFFIVETKGLSLEQTAALFDGDNKSSVGHADQLDVSSEAETGSFVHVSKELPRNEDGSDTNSLAHSYATDTTVVEAIKPAA